MKKILFLLGLVVMLFSCKTTYVSSSTGLDDNAHIKVVKANSSKNSFTGVLTLVIDEQEFALPKIYLDKRSMKAATTPITPGKHQIIIKDGQKVVYNKSLFIDKRETRKIILE